MKVCGFELISLEIIVNILKFVSFQDIYYNKITSTCYNFQNGLIYLTKIIKQTNCMKINSLNYIDDNITLQNSSIFIFRPNIHTPIKKRLFAILDKKDKQSCFFIINPYTNNISLLLKLCSNKILVVLNKSNKQEIKGCELIETMTFERKIVWNNL